MSVLRFVAAPGLNDRAPGQCRGWGRCMVPCRNYAVDAGLCWVHRRKLRELFMAGRSHAHLADLFRVTERQVADAIREGFTKRRRKGRR